MKILFIGDIFGEAAVELLEQELPNLIKEYQINLVIANAENVCRGRGLNQVQYNKLMKAGISAVTLGNHAFSKSEIKEFINEANIVRPANLDTDHGHGYLLLNYNGKKICLINLLGRVYSNVSLDCPFKTMDRILNEIDADCYIIDFHGDATSEKIAFFQEFAGRVDAIVGTHTHVQTADERIQDKTLYITDVGMTGPLMGVIGNTSRTIIKRFRTGVYEPAGVETGPIQLNAVILDFNPIKNKIMRIHKEY